MKNIDIVKHRCLTFGFRYVSNYGTISNNSVKTSKTPSILQTSKIESLPSTFSNVGLSKRNLKTQAYEEAPTSMDSMSILEQEKVLRGTSSLFPSPSTNS